MGVKNYGLCVMLNNEGLTERVNDKFLTEVVYVNNELAVEVGRTTMCLLWR